jgi:hypothetical protein
MVCVCVFVWTVSLWVTTESSSVSCEHGNKTNDQLVTSFLRTTVLRVVSCNTCKFQLIIKSESKKGVKTA